MIRLAEKSDIDEIMAIIADVIREMRSEGSDQWNEEYPAASDFLEDIRRGELFVDAENTLRGFACINGTEPPEYLPVSWARPGPAIVVHRLAVSPECRGKGIAKGLFGFAEETARKAGTNYLKSDTYSLNGPMNSLFRKLGYTDRGRINFAGRREIFHCYDKVL